MAAALDTEVVGDNEESDSADGFGANDRIWRVVCVEQSQRFRTSNMQKNLFETITDTLMSIICGSLLVAGAAGAVTFAYFVIMSCWRLIGSLSRHLFFPWP